jgi:hypothetical protein
MIALKIFNVTDSELSNQDPLAGWPHSFDYLENGQICPLLLAEYQPVSVPTFWADIRSQGILWIPVVLTLSK